METRLIQIGNSRGIRIPKTLVEAAGLDAPLRLRVVDSGLLIERANDPRAGWADAARDLRDRGDGGLLDSAVPTAFDESEWVWEKIVSFHNVPRAGRAPAYVRALTL
ncbi:AbrB/MazE/SpoVT family DNA-binding domain-containing protein [Candidatus Palauibacter sp.]|uniref:AbrB/MazE/SpoVT family DNA-binding domain-containing protein n=1 Tax=Candidatus Palauibacter sp. TaxID=3101350 RepID=UPI003B5CE505